MPTAKFCVILTFIIFGIVRDVFGSTCSWDVYHCDQEEFLCNKEESILLNSKRPLNREHCIAIKNTKEGKFNNYAIDVEMLSLESNEGKNSGYLGLVFNYVDLMNYDFVYLEIHDSSLPPPPKLSENTPAFVTGYRLDGKTFVDDRVTIQQPVLGTKYHSLRLVIDNNSNFSTKIFLDQIFIGSFQEHFAPRLKGGVFIVNEYGSVGLFQNFKIKGCENGFDTNGDCMCSDRALADVRQSINILSNGWQTNSTKLNYGYESACDTGDTWYGYGGSVGALYATFQGFGTATLTFGQCLVSYGSVKVKVFLNEKILSEVTFTGIKEVTFEYSIGDKLTIAEYGISIWKLYSLTLNCN